MSDKTEEATPQRLKKAREDGDSGSSAYAAQATGFVVAVAIVPWAVRALVLQSSEALRVAIADAASEHPSVRIDPFELGQSVLMLVVPIVAAVGVAAAVAHLVQTGAVMATTRLALKLERLNPFEGLKNLFSTTRLFAVVRALVAALLVGWLAYRGILDHVVDVARLRGRIQWAGPLVAELAGTLAWRAALLGLGLGLLDLVVTRSAWRKRLRMGKDEVKRERKDADGDPQLKAARERARHEMLAQVTVANVRQATVVVVNPTHLANALRYDVDAGDQAPVLVASGRGDLAAAMRRAAEQCSIPVLQDIPLAHVLIELPVGQEIPETLYEAVSEVLREVGAHRRSKEQDVAVDRQ